jgi:hypothetical protein
MLIFLPHSHFLESAVSTSHVKTDKHPCIPLIHMHNTHRYLGWPQVLYPIFDLKSKIKS